MKSYKYFINESVTADDIFSYININDIESIDNALSNDEIDINVEKSMFLYDAIIKNKKDIVEYFLKKGIDVDGGGGDILNMILSEKHISKEILKIYLDYNPTVYPKHVAALIWFIIRLDKEKKIINY